MMTTRKNRLYAALSLLALASACVVFAPACSAITNTTAIQCASEAECRSLGPDFAGTTCDKATKTCVKVEDTTGTCSTNRECLDREGGAPAICRRSDKKCVRLTTPECPTVLTKPGNAELANENVVIIGSLTPELHTELGTVMTRMVELAQHEISNNFAQGLPPAPGNTASRPFVVVSCREYGAGIDGLRRGAEHLVNNVQVPLIIGPVDPANGGIVWSQVSNPKKVLTITPTAIISGVANIPNPIAPTPLIWRLNFDDRSIAAVVNQFVQQQLEKSLAARGVPPPYKVGAVYGGDALGVSTHNQTMNTLRFNGKSAAENQADGNLVAVNAGDLVDTVNNPNPDARVAQALAQMFQFRPHIILHEYAPALISKVLFAVEGGWPAGVFRPYHIGHQSFFNGFGPLFPFLNAGNADPTNRRGGRVFAVQNYGSRTAAPYPVDSAPVQAFVQRFDAKFPDFAGSVSSKAQLAWLLYDSTYLAAYAIVAARDKPITGENLAATLPSFVGGTEVSTFDVTQMDVAFRELGAGRTIDIQGLYGSMNFDTAVASPTYGLEITCPNVDPNTKAIIGMKGSGFRYKPDVKTAFVTTPDGVDSPATSSLLGCPPPPL
jgi:hypothetical protein